jgi:hypothetical protein
MDLLWGFGKSIAISKTKYKIRLVTFLREEWNEHITEMGKYDYPLEHVKKFE